MTLNYTKFTFILFQRRRGHIIPGVSNFDDFLLSLYLDISYYHTELGFITDTDF